MNCLQLLFVLVVAVVCADVVRATKCPDGCGLGAFCDKKQNTCVCRSRRVGNGNFLCYAPKYYYACQIASDPMLNTTDKQYAGIKMPAALALTNLTTKRTGRGRGTCQITLDAWSKRFEGKYFIQGLEFKLIQKTQKGKPTESLFRIISKVVNNKYFWKIYEWKNNDWVEFQEIPKRSVDVNVDNCKVRLTRMKSNFLFVNVMCCVFGFGIRPHNPAKPHVIPGVYLLVRNWARFNSLPEGLCNDPKTMPQIDDLKENYGFKSRTQYTTFQGLAHGRPLVYDGAYPDLPALQDTLTGCNKMLAGNFMKKSEFLFNFEKLIACEKERIMELTHRVATAFCDNDQDLCDATKETMKTDCPDVNPNKQMKNFLRKKFKCE